MNASKLGLASLLGVLLATPLPRVAAAKDRVEGVLRFTARHVQPRELVVPAGTPLRLQIVNARQEAIEFESFELNRERVIQPGQSIVLYLPALEPGHYRFFDDLHHDSGKGTITAR